MVGADGPTHAGSFDVTYLSTLPNFIIMAASDEAELVRMINTSTTINDRPCAFRYPRGNGFGINLPNIEEMISIGKGRIIKEGKNVAILSLGTRLQECLKASELLNQKGFDYLMENSYGPQVMIEEKYRDMGTKYEVTPAKEKIADIFTIQDSYWVAVLCFTFLLMYSFLTQKILSKQNLL